MPWINGVKVTNEEWVAYKSGPPVNWKEVSGWKEGDESPSEASQAELEPIPTDPPKQRRTRGKKAQAEAAIAAATGVTVDLDEGDATLDTSGITDNDAVAESDEEESTQ